MQEQYRTARLQLKQIATDDVEFIQALVNTPGWLRFIGDRNIHTREAAMAYTQKIIDAPNVIYWVVYFGSAGFVHKNPATSPYCDAQNLATLSIKRSETQVPMGIITLIKRDYLPHRDIGFAFFEHYGKNGYAFEAAKVVLDDIVRQNMDTHIMATTVPENTQSIQLLEKLGLHFEREIEVDTEKLSLFSVSL